MTWLALLLYFYTASGLLTCGKMLREDGVRGPTDLARWWWTGCVAALLLAGLPPWAWGQNPEGNLRPPFPSRVVPTQHAAPLDGPQLDQEPIPERSPVTLRSPVKGKRSSREPAGGAVRTDGQPTPAEPKVASRTAAEKSTAPSRTAALLAPAAAMKLERAKEPAAGPTASHADKGKAAAEGEKEKSTGGVTTLVKDEFQQARQRVLYVWQYKFFESTTKEFSLSLQVIVGGLLLLWLGHILARRLSAWLGNSVLRRVGLPPATAAPLQKMSFYALFGLFALFSMQLVGVPMTVFTFFGGALAIGIGFGSQNVMNNFISGLILLIERPIRVGDVVQIDAHSGKVSEIGARSTRITTGANLEIIIPNSTFLQGNVINWTLSDDVISSKVSVGVAYGSPARDVARLLKQAADEHELILEKPAPGVSFTEFSEHAMQFELSFWLKMSQADRGRVESDLRFKIDELFADRGIVIAYPQRDVHLNLMRPVEVRLSEATAAPRELRGAA